MKKELDQINFKNIDYSKYSKEINEIKLLVKELKNDKSLMKKLKKFRNKQLKKEFILIHNDASVINNVNKIMKSRKTKKITNCSDDTYRLDNNSIYA